MSDKSTMKAPFSSAEISAMAREAGLTDPSLGEWMIDYGNAKEEIKKFVAIVASRAMAKTAEQTESAENLRWEPVQGGVVIWDSISHIMNESAEKAARDMLERMGIEGVQSLTTVGLMELTNLIAATKKATPAPAWEPLTPERLEKLQKEPLHTKYWLACKQYYPEPVIAATKLHAGRVYFSGEEDVYDPEQISHIMPFITPEMPKA